MESTSCDDLKAKDSYSRRAEKLPLHQSSEYIWIAYGGINGLTKTNFFH
jgi:hypothetical protein